MKRTFKKRWIAAFLSLFIIFSAGLYYLVDTYQATSVAHSPALSVKYDEDKTLVIKLLEGEMSGDAIIFYQGGKVDEKAYIELLAPLAEKGITVYIPSMPFELAVFNYNKAQKVIDRYDHERWFVGGHSLGGSMIASFTSNHQDEIDGLFLLAAYSTSDLSDFKGQVISIYGDQDKVLNFKSMEKRESNLPASTITEVISGGNHAQFGSYGFQKGDGQPLIDQAEQQEITRNLILTMIENRS